MRKTAQLIGGSLVAAAVLLGSQAALADENAQKKTQSAAKETKKDPKSEKTQAPAKTEKTNGQKKRFVDRDGDGIQDGMEHRFRRHKRFGRKSKGRGEGRHLKRAGKGKKNGKNGGN